MLLDFQCLSVVIQQQGASLPPRLCTVKKKVEFQLNLLEFQLEIKSINWISSRFLFEKCELVLYISQRHERFATTLFLTPLAIIWLNVHSGKDLDCKIIIPLLSGSHIVLFSSVRIC